MTFRAKLRKTFQSKGPSSGESTPSNASSSSKPVYYTGRTDIEYYNPHEIPKSKYKGRVDKEHQETLEAFSFGDAFTAISRRSSQALSGIISPGGTKAQSRRPSYISRASRTTRGSVSSVGDGDEGSLPALSRKVTPAVRPPSASVPRVDEGSDEDTDSTKIGTPVEHGRPDIPKVRLDRTATFDDEEKATIDMTGTKSFEQPFTVEELEKAMSKATFHANQDQMAAGTSIAAH